MTREMTTETTATEDYNFDVDPTTSTTDTMSLIKASPYFFFNQLDLDIGETEAIYTEAAFTITITGTAIRLTACSLTIATTLTALMY